MKPEITIGGVVLGLVAVGLAVLFIAPPSSVSVEQATQRAGEPYKEIVSPSGFINTPSTLSGQATPITIKELVGKKVILIDFLTYSCINCQRTFPYLNAWYQKYRDQGLEIVGIHTPEFAFEKNIDNVRAAMMQFGITHPIVLDNEYATWNAYGNRYWPRKYLIDIHGTIVYDHIGEGGYEETEMKIRELLLERATILGENSAARDTVLAASMIAPQVVVAKSPETYFGSSRNEYLANGPRNRSGERMFSIPETLEQNALYLGGVWNIAPEYAESVSDASVVYQYSSKEVFIVADADVPIEVEVIQDGKPVGVSRGVDVRPEGIVTIKESRLYKLIQNAEPGEHILELRIKGAGLRFYAFTFG